MEERASIRYVQSAKVIAVPIQMHSVVIIAEPPWGMSPFNWFENMTEI